MIPPVVSPELLQRVQDVQSAQAALQTAASAQSRALPSDIFNLAPGSTFNATITQADAKGLLTLSTDAGSFQLRLSVPQNLPTGGVLSLQVTQIGDQSAQFRLVSLDGQTLVQTQNTQLPNAVPAASSQQGNAQVQAETAAAQVRAPTTQLAGIPTTVIAPADPAQAQMSTLNEPWQPGTQLAVRIVAMAPPAVSQAAVAQAAPLAHPSAQVNLQNTPVGVPQAAATQTAGAVGAPASGAESHGARDASLQFGANAQQRPAFAQQQAAPSLQAAPSPWMSTSRDNWAPYSPTLFSLPENPSLGGPAASVPLLLSGTVAPNTANGRPIISTPAGMLAVETQPILPGSKVTLEVVGQPIPPAAIKGAGETMVTPFANSVWPAMDEAIEALRISDPAGAQQILAALPSLSPRMAANMTAYMGALRQGDLKNWLGEKTIDAIERKGGRELVKRLESEFKELSAVPARPRATSSGNWSSYVIPMMSGQQIEPVQLNIRNTPQDVDEGEGKGGRQGKGGGTRFVIDLDLSRLGQMQIDGLMRGPEKKIDFIVRTNAVLPSEMRFDLNRIVDSMAQASGLIGSIIFQANARFVDTPKLDLLVSRKKPGTLV